MTKLFLKIFIVLAVLSSLAFVITLKSLSERTNERDIAVNTAAEERFRAERFIKLADSLQNETGSKEVVYHARDKRTKDFFTFLKVGRSYMGYEIISDLHGIDRTAFDYIFWTCVDSGIDIPFLMHVLWTESRFGTNITHKLNRDGSKDGGWFGINYKDPREAEKSSPYTDVYKFIKKYRKLESFPKSEWASRYNSKVLWLK